MRKRLMLCLFLVVGLFLAGCTAATDSSGSSAKKQVASSNLQDFGMILTEQDTQVVVLAVQEDSSAERCGVRAGDTILKIRDEQISAISQVESSLFTQEKGTWVLRRNEEELTLTLPLSEL